MDLKQRATTLDTSQYVEFSENYLTFKDDTPYEVWESVTAHLVRAERSIRWWIGDAIRFGEAKYGERYTQALEATGLAYQTLANSVYVASKYAEPSSRKENCTFRQHEIVATLEPGEREEVLEKAYHEGWTERTLLEEARERRSAPPSAGVAETVLMQDCPHCDGRGRLPVETEAQEETW